MELVTAITAGLLTFLSPCILPLIPLYLGYLGATLDQPGRNILRVLPFVLGFSLVFISLGLTATGLGSYLLTKQQLLEQISAVALIALGLIMSGLLPIPWLRDREYKISYLPTEHNWISALLFGMVFALGWTPCTGPVLAGILLYAGAADTMFKGAILLGFYSLGIGLPIMATAYFADRLLIPLLAKGQLMRYLHLGGGLLMSLIGLLLLIDII